MAEECEGGRLRELVEYLGRPPLDLEFLELEEVFRQWAAGIFEPEKMLELWGTEDAGFLGQAEFDMLPDESHAAFTAMLEIEGHIRCLAYELGPDAPAWMILGPADGQPRIERTVIVHVTPHAEAIAKEGFRYGINDIEDIAVTRRNDVYGNVEHCPREGAGYSFGLPAEHVDRIAGHLALGNKGYGSQAVVFVAEAVRIWHNGDREEQLVFDGAAVPASVMVPVIPSEGEFMVEGQKLDVRTAIMVATKAALAAAEEPATSPAPQILL